VHLPFWRRNGSHPGEQWRNAFSTSNCAHHRPVRLSWAKLLKRVFEIDMEHCPNCGGQLKITTATVAGLGARRGRLPHTIGCSNEPG